jgi:ketosteroid isomerase-like protein
MYDNYLVQMDTDSLALLYAQNGKLGEVATGRDSIRKFLQTFSNYKVLSNTSTTDSVKIIADTATQVGTYKQVTITPQKDTAHVQGSFHAKWVFYKKEGWKIQKMKTL